MRRRPNIRHHLRIDLAISADQSGRQTVTRTLDIDIEYRPPRRPH